MNIIKHRIFLSFLILSIVPLIFTILEISFNEHKLFKNFLFYYNHMYSFIFTLKSLNAWSLFLTFFLIVYNFWISVFIYKISNFTKNHILVFSIILALISVILWWMISAL